MKFSLPSIDKKQRLWGARTIALDMTRDNYAFSVEANLFRSRLHEATADEFRSADGSELRGTVERPAKMSALMSSSALAVNFFDAWRDAKDLWPLLGKALSLPGDIQQFRFEYKPQRYPVGPRTPNMDLLFELTDGHSVGVESKFAEPYRSSGSKISMSPKYFPADGGLWEKHQMSGAQSLASRLGDGWKYLDTAQLLKHMLGLACGSDGRVTLLYLWYDTGFAAADAQRSEVARFSDLVSGGRVAFKSLTYQELFASLPESVDPAPGWREYMQLRYFS